ncbi:zona pellucida sperm-binding protein 4 [Cricetulus griseus]|uniref:Zona pellucida sperm-binding protein 4 n=2 Tax=Cricetulus griseus TaxID=10029 RepID=A0A8C2MTM6_CRIGR|nr:zona pellucida sperm-binding protein 4 [Cricetulus griseus]XP_027261294.1 zona pellucida sperm-binding protein 4 [Cricetulus griseus]
MTSKTLSSTLWLLPGIFLCFPFCPPLSGQHVTELPGMLHCGLRSFQFTVNLSLEAGSPMLTTWDSQGLPHRLKNDSDCGTWVMDSPDGSLVLEATYNGCYVTMSGSHYAMEVGVQEVNVTGHMAGSRKRLLKCPLDLQAQNTLNTEVCNPVPVKERLPCAPLPVSRGDCDKLGCCYISEEEEVGYCYYGNTVTSQCTREGRFSIAVSRNVTSPPLNLDSLHLIIRSDSGCDPIMATPTFALFQFPFTSCGTTRRVIGDQVVYENELLATQEVRTWGSGSITRDSIFRLQVSCSYSVFSNTSPINMQVLTLPPPLPKTQTGPLSLELQIAKDKTYGSYHGAEDYPLVKFLQDPIYVEVSILHRTDPSLELLLEQCWATPGPNPFNQPQWPILVKGCPYAGDNYQTRRIDVQKASSPFPSHHQRFSISTFSFTNAVREEQAFGGQVYLHCSALVCQPAGTPSCMAICPASRRRRKSELYFKNNTASISSKGPVIFLQAIKDPKDKLHRYSSISTDSPALWVVGLSAITIIIGVLLVFYLAIRILR